MKFRDRISGEHIRVLAKGNKRYYDHLTKNGFAVSDDLFRYFAGEVFHDSEIKILSLSSDGSAVLQMRNIFAIDHFSWNVRPGVRDRRLSAKLFSTRITFHEISRFVWSPLEPQEYNCAELDRLANGRLRLDIFCPTPGGVRRTIRIECSRIDVEDIMPRIKSMLPKRELAKIVLWPSESDFHQSTLTSSRGK